jgi:hypothetical protein
MKNRHDTPVTTPQSGCNSLMYSKMPKIISGMGACFVSICVYFCLLFTPLILCGAVDGSAISQATQR